MDPLEFRRARLQWGLSQREMAALVGTRTSRTVRKWEHSERQIPDAAIILVELYRRYPGLLEEVPQLRHDVGIPPVSDAEHEEAQRAGAESVPA